MRSPKTCSGLLRATKSAGTGTVTAIGLPGDAPDGTTSEILASERTEGQLVAYSSTFRYRTHLNSVFAYCSNCALLQRPEQVPPAKGNSGVKR